jgi:hypothetical protein
VSGNSACLGGRDREGKHGVCEGFFSRFGVTPRQKTRTRVKGCGMWESVPFPWGGLSFSFFIAAPFLFYNCPFVF